MQLRAEMCDAVRPNARPNPKPLPAGNPPSQGTTRFAATDGKTVTAYVEDLRSTLNEGSIMNRKAFLNSFIRRINIKDSEAEIEYTCPIGLGGNRRNEVLSMERIGSLARSIERTFKITVLLGNSRRGKPYFAAQVNPNPSESTDGFSFSVVQLNSAH
jgi:hypothetical protein